MLTTILISLNNLMNDKNNFNHLNNLINDKNNIDYIKQLYE